MSYEKQTWNKYDDLKTEEENIENGAVVTDNRMNHIEDGIGDNNTNLASHLADTNNPHKVTAAQVGLDKVDNVKQASKAEFDSHTSDASNPHKVTASQVGSYSKSESDDKLATQKQAMDSHVNNKANPHAVTASQVGAYSKQEIDTKLSNADSILGKVYPVGAYYFSSQSTEPATLFGFGTWSRVKGRGLVGVDESDSALSSGGKQGGSINPLSQHTIAPSSGQFVVSRGSGTSHWSSASAPSSSYAMDTEASGITVGDNTNHNNWQPFEAAYIWKRTA
ncbi:Hypothetical protein NCDO2118_1438 [Lactococcus lactis subsp. lactis NCDO 2118]|uniref:Baseplate structural protein Gp10 C-terminal domain-containing protein n=2 Tax=Lactococcus lactis TaxID=1358 RepID=A0ABC8A7L3_LACLL|nr:hypothetical protein [Lactococcus lactis]AII12916.1 Hypothetical protein NCDO2118_1438 [Lactococcus lactis subsp. lactis NCDO 2118]